MKSVYLLQWQRFRRAPVVLLTFLFLTVVFVAVLGGLSFGETMTIYTYTDPALDEEERDAWLARLDEPENLEFRLVEEDEAREAVANGDISVAVKLLQDDYRLLVGADDPNRFTVEGYVNRVFTEELRIRQAESRAGTAEIGTEVEQLQADPPLELSVTSAGTTEDSFQYDGQLQMLFGMTLFFSVYTIMYSLMNIAEEKRHGTWDRLIFSPLRKWEIYMGHLLFTFTYGYLQIILVFLLFTYGFNFPVGNDFGAILLITGCYTFATVALGMLVLGLVKTTQQLQAVIPIVATGMGMIGGAFWPIELVSNDILLTISKVLPITYGLDALKDIAIYGRGLSELAEPLAIMLLFGVVCMGVGINLMERRYR